MVARLWGTCNGAEITCNPVGGALWETAVPAAPDGVYVFELWAEDEAGNVGYFATVRLSYDPSKLCFTVEILEVGAGFSMEDVRRALLGDGVRAILIDETVGSGLAADPVFSEIVKCEVCGQ